MADQFILFHTKYVSSRPVLTYNMMILLSIFKETNSRNGNKSDVLVRAVTEAELLWLPLLVVTVMVYRRPGVRTLKVHSLASQEKTL